MLTKKQLDEIKKELDTCKNPLFLFDDDPDGVSSFLLFYRYLREGHGVIVKTKPVVEEKFLRKVQEYHPDKIFILDVPMVTQDFIDQAKTPIIWIDHHSPQTPSGNVKYFNPRIENPSEYSPASYLCYQVVRQDLWIAMVGTVGDWSVKPELEKLRKKYPQLVGTSKKPEELLYKSQLGRLVRIFSFLLKGNTRRALKNVRILTRITSPHEIINQETPQAKYLMKQIRSIENEYSDLLKKAIKKVKKEDKFIVFTYPSARHSLTSDLATELSYLYPDKIIIVAREKSGQMKTSLRSRDVVIREMVEQALAGLEGYGGGHEYACGANVAVEDFALFIQRLREGINKVGKKVKQTLKKTEKN